MAAVIATCYSNPGLYPQARFAADLEAELRSRAEAHKTEAIKDLIRMFED